MAPPPSSSSSAAEVDGLELGFGGLRRVEEWEAALGREGALPKDTGKKARIAASSSISPPSAMGPLAGVEVGTGDVSSPRFEIGRAHV